MLQPMEPMFVAQAAVLPTALWPIPADHECGMRQFAVPELQVAFTGRGKRWLTVEGRHLEVATSPNMMELYASNYEIDATRWRGSEGYCVAIQFPREALERLSEFGPEPFNLTSAHALSDPRVAQLSKELASEYRRGLPHGILFAEGLSIALVGALTHRYRAQIPERVGSGLTTGQQTMVREFIEAHLGSALRIRQLASLVNMSDAQFAKRFKASVGIAPHQYVLKRRLTAADVELRRRPGTPLADLAFSLGFSSQAHFTEAFRRTYGCTPAAVRKAGQRT